MFSLSAEQINSIALRLDFLRVEAGDLLRFATMTQADYITDRDRRRSLERLVENIVNACTDIVKIVLSSEDLPVPETYRDAMVQAGIVGLLEESLAEKLAEFTRMRNIIAHQYLDIRWAALRNFIDDSPAALRQFISNVEALLNKAT
ncbi:MAG: DUF86 domain-containing protein [Firmicutes bacterium]|nr:DUF86 domain-containing protein [Bacillota bacterium]